MATCLPIPRDRLTSIAACIYGPMKARTMALVEVGISTGFRISELLSLDRAQVMTPDGHIMDRITVERRNMKGKTRSRTAKLNSRAKIALASWLVQLEAMGGVTAHTPVFATRSLSRMGRRQADKCLRPVLHRLGIRGCALGTHTLRKTFADLSWTTLRRRRAEGADVDPFPVMVKLMGHDDPKATMRYLSFAVAEYDDVIDEIGDWDAFTPETMAQNC